jgi:hypothetical protein
LDVGYFSALGISNIEHPMMNDEVVGAEGGIFGLSTSSMMRNIGHPKFSIGYCQSPDNFQCPIATDE